MAKIGEFEMSPEQFDKSVLDMVRVSAKLSTAGFHAIAASEKATGEARLIASLKINTYIAVAQEIKAELEALTRTKKKKK